MFYSEKEAEDFLEKNGFDVIKRAYASDEQELKKVLGQIDFPIVMKVCGKKIVHKNVLGGIILNIESEKDAFDAFGKLKKISEFEGATIQSQIDGKEVLIGVKNTPDFGHAVGFGAGGVNTEKLKDVSFRIFPFDKTEAKKMILSTNISKKLNRKERESIMEALFKINSLIKKYPKISELDINPLMVKKNKTIVVDARIVFE